MSSNDPIAKSIGEIGRWQIQNILIVGWVSIPGLAHIFASAFITSEPDFSCSTGVSNKSNVCECTDGFEYDTSFWKRTLVTEWDLVCEKKYLTVIAKMVLFAGFGAGTFLAGIISDKQGRKQAILLMAQLLFGSGILATTMTNFIAFCIAWFLTGMAAIGCFTVCFVWALESVSGKWKTIVGMSVGFAWPFARLLVCGISYAVRDWKLIMQILSCMHIVTPFLMSLVPESPRWLLAKNGPGQREAAMVILEDAARINKRTDKLELDKIAIPDVKREGFLDIFKHSVLRRRALVMFFNWFACSLIIYGLSLNWKQLTGTLFLNFLIGTALDFPAKFLALVLIAKGGRKRSYIACISVVGVVFFCQLFISRGVYVKDWPIVLCAFIGNLFVSTCFAILWVYTAELFPTNIRNAALGSSSLLARIGGMAATSIGRLAEINIIIPTILFGTCAVISSLISFFLPETAGKPLPKSVDECKETGRKS